jgi:uncharacterized DUF497 family protein
MLYEWDEEKNRENLLKHGLDFTDAWEIFNAPMLIVLDDRQDYGEDRWIGMGLLRNRVVVVVYTERGEDTIRIISLRKALSHERKQYEKALQDGLGQG